MVVAGAGLYVGVWGLSRLEGFRKKSFLRPGLEEKFKTG
jgi:hypothetical protein